MNSNEQTFSPRGPIIVFSALIFLTIATVMLSGLDIGNIGALIIAMSVASVKAGLVLYFFMHLNHEPLIFKLFVALAFVTLATLFLLTFSDYAFRGIA
ncbi:MAG: cytochrome-c oxidase [Candidatus Marinimicrobia bacterium]|nr:cytochrome-c oxidase [Candidatus Neomarinimicrobiota bacterium]MBT3679474.1 cytochrome-c oxidase [Candidatus Neomarinimicrobiota bacterium]MBT3951057.1 cytochrome-c oxidase [Candidatus Neomarinimicrobiota bacterium]MBT4254263.1 cytochrome-c oxidase [Candidatus Neomarinimicrobiota bacterium]MBT4479444.1 cytochrome-c oxidase [Candidatus Neomarinimicrobiota bacterium]